MKFVWLSAVTLLLGGCAVGPSRPLKTQIVTFPEGGIVEVNGKRYGKEPLTIALPQNEKGQLTENVEIRALPSDHHLHAATRVLAADHPDHKVQVPGRVVVDMRQVPDSTNVVNLVKLERERKIERKQIKAQESRSKPTRPVGDY
jgi:hypothetical protein